MTDTIPPRTARLEAALADRLRRGERRLRHVDKPHAPLSYVQQSLWILARLAEGEPVNHRPLRLRLRGELDRGALREALDTIADRHTVLRTTFPLEDGEPIQRIHPPAPVTLPTVDVSASPDPESAAESAAADHLARPFDLTSDVAFRPLLVHLGPSDHLLVVAFHHIVFDGWSEHVFVDELLAHYDAGGTSPDVPEMTIDYADFARWERARTDEARIAADLHYWRSRLADLPPDLELPPDRGVGAAGRDPVGIVIPDELTKTLERVAADRGATLFMTLLTVLQILVARHSGQDDIVVGVPTAGRPLTETEPLIGCFINTVALRADVGGNPPFAHLLDQVRTATLEALDHSRAPFGRVFGELRPWTPDRVPLYRVHFQLRNFPMRWRSSPSLDVSVVDEPAAGGNHLTVRAVRHGDHLEMTFGYDPTRFRRTTIERWAGHYLNLVRAVAADPGVRIREPELIDDAERRRVLVDFNRGGARRLPAPILVADRLRERARIEPDTAAVEDGETVTGYGELDGMIDRVATALIERGLGTDDRVVVYGDRSLPTIAGIIGALRAGVAYIPVDAGITAPWITRAVDEARPRLVLTRPALLPSLPDVGLDTVLLDDLLAGPPVDPVETRATPEDLAYVLYTSGSTGPPKGVLVEQRNLAWFLDSLATVQPLAPGDRILLAHSISFDAVADDLHAPLTAGATVVVADDDVFASVPRFLEFAARRRVTHLRLPTSFFHVLAAEVLDLGLDLPSSLRFLGFGGEQARADLVERWCRRFGDVVELHNSYGPTETTVSVTEASLASLGPDPVEWVPIGRPHPGSSVYVLDDRGRPAPIGVVGELHIGGPLVTRGYLGAPELTARRFLADPFSPGGRMYRSGDLGRWLDDGTLEVLGRVDRQVKIRGYRVEPGEVEAALRSTPGVVEAAVVVRPAADQTLGLFAYVTGDVDGKKVWDHLAAVLPSFLLPVSVTVVEDLPRTAGGKVDVARLPDPSPSTAPRPSTERSSAAPHVAQVWREVLGIDAVGPDADFFELGGHSLLAIRLMSRLADRVGVELPLTTLFEHPTLGALTAAVDAALGADPDAPSPAEPVTDPIDATAAEPEDLEALLEEIESLSDDEAAALLARLDEEGR